MYWVLGDLDASMRVEYYLNDERMNMDVEKIFNRMKKDDVLKVITFTTDALFNLEKSSMNLCLFRKRSGNGF